MRNIVWTFVFSGIFNGLSMNGWAAADRVADVPIALDSSVGKSPLLSMLAESAKENPAMFRQWWVLNGGQPWVISQTPPKTRGVALQYDSSRYFFIYTEYRAPQNHYAPSGWMGDYGDLKVDDNYQGDCADGKTCIQINYSAKSSQGAGWAGIYWQHPMNNWGSRYGGYDWSGFKRLTFWVKGAQGGEVVSEFRIGGISGKYEDTGTARIGPLVLGDKWEEIAIDLKDVNLKHIMGGFAWAASASDNREGMTFYIDEIRLEK